MTDWDRVERLRAKGLSWDRIAADPKVGFTAPPGTAPGRALRHLHYARRSRDRGARRAPSKAAGGTSTRPPGRSGDSERSRRSLLLGVGVIAAVVAVIGYVLIANPFHAPSPGSNVVAYCGGEGSAAHFHVLLVISIDGAQQHLPYDPTQSADIGYIDTPAFTNPSFYCPDGGLHALHTHDGSGIIHAELPPSIANSGSTPTLGDFFTIWGQNLTPTHVWVYQGRLVATELNMNNGVRTDYSSDPASIPLWYPAGGPSSNPFPIPPSLIFNGQFGDGASGGTFDGEIIWLNITGAPGGAHPVTPPAPVRAPHPAEPAKAAPGSAEERGRGATPPTTSRGPAPRGALRTEPGPGRSPARLPSRGIRPPAAQRLIRPDSILASTPRARGSIE
jgi:hypothetical protein